MDSRSLIRELSLVTLGLINDNKNKDSIIFDQMQFEITFESALELMTNHCLQELDDCQISLENASNILLDSELREIDSSFFEEVRGEIKKTFIHLENIMNTLSDTLEIPKLIAISGQKQVRDDIKSRLSKVLNNILIIDKKIDDVMEDWRFKRLPRIDRDILRLAYVDIVFLNTPVSVACNEAVNLANKYSDTKGRKMINGILRRMQKEKIK
tara:strand:- start:215 stop:850 length:636 start_codon:yes stop_codon:yes gene_type:complete